MVPNPIKHGMIWGYPYFWKHPHRFEDVFPRGMVGGMQFFGGVARSTRRIKYWILLRTAFLNPPRGVWIFFRPVFAPTKNRPFETLKFHHPNGGSRFLQLTLLFFSQSVKGLRNTACGDPMVLSEQIDFCANDFSWCTMYCMPSRLSKITVTKKSHLPWQVPWLGKCHDSQMVDIVTCYIQLLRINHKAILPYYAIDLRM